MALAFIRRSIHNGERLWREYVMSSNLSSAHTQTITVKVTLFADLRRYLAKGVTGPQPYTLPAGATVADLIALLGIPAGDAAEVTAGRNGDQAQHDDVLHDGDDLVLFSPMEGG
jgi:sulfur carrier protein ThiS